MNMEPLKHYATELLKIALEKDLLYEYLFSIEPFVLSIREPNGGYASDQYFKMYVLYDYYKSNPDIGLEKKLFDTLNEWTKKGKSSKFILSLLNVIECQILSELEKTAPFKLNNELLLSNLKKNLSDNRSLYESEIYEKKGFMGSIREHDEKLYQNYGHKIL